MSYQKQSSSPGPYPGQPATVVSVISHGQAALVANLLEDIQQYWNTDNLSVVLTLNLPETLPFDPQGFSFPVLVVSNEQPKGFGANHNTAFDLTCCEHFCVLNPDIRSSSDPLPGLRRELAQVRRAGLVAPAIVNRRGALEDSARRILTPTGLLKRVLLRRRETDYPVLRRERVRPDWVAGMFMLIRAQDFANIGGFDERYFMYCEDADLCTRLWLQGRGVSVVSNSQVVHDARRASHSSLQHLYWHITSLLRFFLAKRQPADAR